MKLQETSYKILIEDDRGVRFDCPVSEFTQYEPDYPPLPVGYISRLWDEARGSMSTGSRQTGDPEYSYTRLAAYCGKIAHYQAAYAEAHPPDVPEYTLLYAAITLEGGDGEPIPAIYPGDKDDETLHTLSVSGSLLSDPQDPQSLVTVSHVWRVPIFQVARERFLWEASYTPPIIDAFLQQIDLVDGAFALPDFTREHEGVYMISDESFELIDGAAFGLSGYFKVVVVDGPLFFKVILTDKIKKT